MTKTVRSRLKAIVAERRKARRHQTRRAVALVAGVTFETAEGTELVTGRTRDVGKAGMSLSLPVNGRQQELLTVNGNASVVLALPKRKIILSATVMHSQLLAVNDPGRGMLVGLQIAQISPEDRRAYEEYVNSLKGISEPL